MRSVTSSGALPNTVDTPTASSLPARVASSQSASHAPDRARERELVEQALVRARGVVSRAAAELGLSRQALYRLMERLDIELERRPKS